MRQDNEGKENCLVFGEKFLGEQNKLNQNEVFLEGSPEEIEQIRKLKQWNVLDLWVKPNILKILHPIHFPFLTRLFLSNNHIQSIEKLHQMDMPVLQNLILAKNNIMQIKDMRKWVVRNLQGLFLQQNKIKEEGGFSFLSCEIYHFVIEYMQSNSQVNDISWICKMRIKYGIYMESRQRILQRNVVRLLRGKQQKQVYLSPQNTRKF